MLIPTGGALFLSIATAPTATPSVHAFADGLVYVVGVGKNHHRVGLRQTVHRQFALIVFGCLVACHNIAIPAVEEAWLDGQVEHHVLCAVILARAFAEL